MSTIAVLFLYYVTDLSSKFGYGTSKMSDLSAGTILQIEDSEAEKLRSWLITNGYLYEYATTRKITHGWSSHRISYGIRWTGVTTKGWAIAPKYTGFASKDDAELELRNAYALDHAGTDMLTDPSEYRENYIRDRRPGWFFL